MKSMKSRETLIRLKKFQAEERRRTVAQIESMISGFERISVDLERDIKIEQDRSGIHDPAHFAYPTYAKAAIQRRDNLKRSAHDLKIQLEDAKADARRSLRGDEEGRAARRTRPDPRADRGRSPGVSSGKGMTSPQANCRRCRRVMREVAEITPIGSDPGLVAFVCSYCGAADSAILYPKNKDPRPADLGG
jgi:hypothetical protein